MSTPDTGEVEPDVAPKAANFTGVSAAESLDVAFPAAPIVRVELGRADRDANDAKRKNSGEFEASSSSRHKLELGKEPATSASRTRRSSSGVAAGRMWRMFSAAAPASPVWIAPGRKESLHRFREDPLGFISS